jgi:3-oxoacyl-(acyl-carrier-protein) synthase
MNPVVVTGMGIVSAAGRGLDATTSALRDGRSGLGTLTLFDSPRCGHFPVAEVESTELDRSGQEPRTLALGREALDQALQQAGLDSATRDGAGLSVGTCVAGMPETERAVAAIHAEEPIDESVWGRHECGYTSHALAGEFELGGPVTTLSTACSSSAQAIGGAQEMLGLGALDVMVAGGTDALCRLTLNGFASLLNVSPDGCQPFDVARTGMSLGEGAAFLVFETLAHAKARGAEVLAVLLGHAHSCDAHHATAPHPDGDGAKAAMELALRAAKVLPSEVSYINAHGTGTVENDRAEGRAVRRLFGDRQPLLSSTKRVFGHTLGAAGAIEAVVSILALRGGFAPGTLGLYSADPECEVDLVAETRDAKLDVVLSNSFGFGGNNTSLCFQSAEALE